MTTATLIRPAGVRPDLTGPPVATRTPAAALRTTIAQSVAMAWRGLVKVSRTPEQYADVVLQPVIFTLMFGYLFGGAVAGSVRDYLPMLIPGILVMSLITASTVTGTQLREDMDEGVFDRFRSLPISRVAPLAGGLLADVVRYVIAATLTMVMGVIMGWRPTLGGAVASALLVIVCAWAVSWIFALLGVSARSASAVQGMSALVLFPLTFLSNSFVPVTTLPGWLQGFVQVNPMSHVVTAVRELTAGGTGGPDVLWALLGAAIVIAVFAPLAVRGYMRKV
ncbi:MAG: ABC transporter permease [Micrococcales bacterium]|nr:ABC transporter permease [Micrococcales bacterium]